MKFFIEYNTYEYRDNIQIPIIPKFIFIIITIYTIIKINLKILNYDNFLDFLPKTNLIGNNYTNLSYIFESRLLYINDKNITKEYIHFIRPLNISYKINTKYNKTKKFKKVKYNFKKRKDMYGYKDYISLCNSEKLLNSSIYEFNDSPLISVILPSYNKEKVLMKSIRSIQNQSLKNIEIIIVDDFSTDNSNKYYKYLLETDPRIRIFLHQKNMGVWRTRLDGFLYSKGKYVIHFDTGDLYEDNYVLEDLYEVAENYNLDSVKMLFRIFQNTTDYENYKLPLNYTSKYSKIFTYPSIEKYDRIIFGNYTNIWNRLTKNEIFTKGLYLLNTYILNIYKNLWEDIWWNKIANKVSNNYLVVKRYGYIYYKDGSGEGSFKIKSDLQKDKLIHEFIYFIYFNLQLLSKRSKKKYIINRLRFHNETLDHNLNMFKTKFFLLNNLLKLLIKDRFVSIKDKIFVYKLLKESIKRQKTSTNNN